MGTQYKVTSRVFHEFNARKAAAQEAAERAEREAVQAAAKAGAREAAEMVVREAAERASRGCVLTLTRKSWVKERC